VVINNINLYALFGAQQ